MEEAVSYKIEPYTYDGILEVELIGTARDNEFKKMMYELDAILEANNAKEVILDIRSFEEHIESTTIYNYTTKHNFFIRVVKTAVVDTQEKTSFAIALKNAGVSVERFSNMDLARKWVKFNPIRDTWQKETAK
jgi:hypothetical protein